MTPLLTQLSAFWAQVAPFALTGVIVSAAVQALKQFVSKTGHTIAISVGLSVVGGLVVYFIGAVPETWLTAIVGVLAASNAIYALVIKQFEATQPPQA